MPDLIDQAFLDRWQATLPPKPQPAPTAPTPCCNACTAPTTTPVATTPVATTPVATTPSEDGGLVDRLLASASDEWNTLAGEVEAARQRGRRVIAVVGSEPGEGRTTIVAGLVQSLRSRGRDAVSCTPCRLSAEVDDAAAPAHGKRIVIVDAGIWFPPGPIRRQRLLIASLGCDAAILVRPAHRPPADAWAVALAAIGVEPLGEVLSFTTQAAAAGEVS